MYADRYFKPVKYIYGDITKPDQVKDAIAGRKIDYVIWAAALVGDALCAKDPEFTHKVNVEAVKSFSKIYDGPCFFFSTCSVYGANNDLLDEGSPVNPLSVYASTKLEAERILLERQNVLVYRLGTLLGLSGEDARPRMDLVGNALTMKAIRNDPITVFGGEQMRPLMSVKEVAHAVCFGIDRGLTGLFTIAERNMNISELAVEIKERTKSKSEIVVTDIPFEDMRNYRVDCSKLKNTGWSTLYPIKLAIDEFAQNIRENRVKNADLNLYYNGRYSI